MHSFEPQAHRPLAAELPPWGVSVLESHHASDFRMGMERHEFWQLLYVVRGEGSLQTEASPVPLVAGQAIALPPGTPHALVDKPGRSLSLYAVNVSPQLMAGSSAFEGLLGRTRRLTHPALSALMPDTLRRLLVEQTLAKPGYEAMMTGLALQMLATLVRLQSGPSSEATPQGEETPLRARVANYIQELDRRFYRSETVDQVATRLGMSRRRFTELFREATASSWLPYVRKLRVEHACRLLAGSERTVLSIAFECGFEDVSSFYRAFKAAFSTSPDQWRRVNRPNREDK